MLQLKKLPDIPVSTREEARESWPHPEEPVSVSYLERRDPFPAWLGKNSRRSRRISRGGALHRKGERNPGSCHHSQSQPDVSVHFRETYFPCTASTSRRGLTHTTVVRGTALWESLVGKPQWKASRESPSSLDQREGKRDTADTAREKGHVHAPTRDED